MASYTAMGGDCKLTCLSPTSDNEFFENRMGYAFTVGTVQAFTFFRKVIEYSLCL